jgi:hypothetical protein
MKKYLIVGIFLLFVLSITTVIVFIQKNNGEKYKAPFNRYGVQVVSSSGDQKADKRRDEYIRRAQLLRVGFEKYALENQQKIKEIIDTKTDTDTRVKLISTILPWDPIKAIPNWDSVSESVSATDFESRLSESFIFTWNAVNARELDNNLSIKIQKTAKIRNNYILSESIGGKESVVFWIDGSITEEFERESNGSPNKEGRYVKIADKYDFLKKG